MSFFRNTEALLKFKQIFYHRRLVNTKSLAFKKFGEPIDVLEIIDCELPEPKNDQVLVEVLLAPINPSDINYIQGRYAKKPKEFPAIAGNEFVGKVEAIGKEVTKMKPGDTVIPLQMGLGSWSSHMLLKECQLYKVQQNIDLVQAATMSINPCTAYRMLTDFVKLGVGDCVIQNGANSAVGQSVHQLCKLWGIKSVGLVRDRPDVMALKEYLKGLGACEIFTDNELKETKVFQEYLSKPKLALNCVGGEFAELIAKKMADHGTMVTYGGMSLKPFRLPAGPLIFRQQKFVGFWLTNWTETHGGTDAQTEMYDEILHLMSNQKLVVPPFEFIRFKDFKEIPEALSLSNFSNTKFLFDLRNHQKRDTGQDGKKKQEKDN